MFGLSKQERLSRRAQIHDAEAAVNQADMYRQFTASLLDEFGELNAQDSFQKESFEGENPASIAREDRGWVNLLNRDGQGMTERARRETVKNSRASAMLDGLCKQIISLWTSFGIGTGVTWTAEDDSPTQIALDEIWKNPANRSIFSMQGQRTSSNKLLIDGELPLIIFGERDFEIRRTNPLNIQIAYDPDDMDTPRYYVRVWLDNKGEKRVVYRDWMNVDKEPGRLTDGKEITEADPDLEPEAVMNFIKLFGDNPRSEPLLTTVLPWARRFRMFMRSRHAIQQMLAMFAYKMKAKGNVDELRRQAAKLDSKLGQGTTDSNPPPTTASTWIENEGMDLQPQKQETAANSAKIDGNMIMQVLGVSGGVFPHYLGSGDAFRLATATAMEPPMAKQFDAYRKRWHDEYNTLNAWMLLKIGVEPAFSVDSPEVFPTQTKEVVDGIQKTVAAFPKAGQSDVLLTRAMVLLGVDDPVAALADMEDDGTPANSQEAAAVLKFIKTVRQQVIEEAKRDA